MLSEHQYLCARCRHGYESKMEGADLVLGVIGNREGTEVFKRVKQSPGSGVLSVSVIADGPTRILKITDENKKVY